MSTRGYNGFRLIPRKFEILEAIEIVGKGKTDQDSQALLRGIANDPIIKTRSERRVKFKGAVATRVQLLLARKAQFNLSFDQLIEWLKENWELVLKTLISIIMMVL